MKLNPYILITSIFFISLTTTHVAVAGCTIESGPPAELARYIEDTRTAVQDINARYPNICPNIQSPGDNFEKVLSVIDRAEIQAPIINNLIADFSYNVLTVSRFESSPIVIRHGNLFYTLEKSSILPAIETLANKCQLDWAAAWEIIDILKKHKEIHEFFKRTVIGTAWVAESSLESAILTNYSQEATLDCKDNLDLSVWVEKLLKFSEGFGSDISAAKSRWEESLRLIRWWSAMWTRSYNSLQTKLLRQELSQQWVGQGAIQQMMKNLECAQADSDEKLDIEKQALSETKCKRNYILWLENLSKVLDRKRWEARNSDEYINITQKVNKTLTRQIDIVSLYAWLNTTIKASNNADATTKWIIQNLINTHTTIEWMNMLIEKRIPKMKENCMKWSVDIVGWC